MADDDARAAGPARKPRTSVERLLTPAQRLLLREAIQFGRLHVVEHYEPRKRLLDLGLIRADGDHVEATPAARAALAPPVEAVKTEEGS